MKYNFNSEDKAIIIDRFGNEFFSDVNRLLKSLILKWNLDDLQLINSFSSNLVFKCTSKTYGSIVMKFGRDNVEFLGEVNALKSFSDSCTCKLLDVDFENKVLLEECLIPGDELVQEKRVEKRLEVFCDLFHQLHSADKKGINADFDISNEHQIKSYKDWIFKITDYMILEENWNEVTLHMKRAKELYLKLSQEYPTQSLLHGDFHYYNILKTDSKYKIIDPKGIIGNPIFDVPRYILNEFWDEDDKTKVDKTIETVFNGLSYKLNLSRMVLSKLLYIEGTMAICWCIEDGAKIEDKIKFLDTLIKLESYMV